MTASPTALATFSAILERQGYPPDEALARAESLYGASERPVRYSASCYAADTGTDDDTGAGTYSYEPSARDKMMFRRHMQRRGLGHMLANLPGQDQDADDYQASAQDDEAFDGLMKHYGMGHLLPRKPYSMPPSTGGDPASVPLSQQMQRQQAGPAPEFTKADMDRCLAYQSANPGIDWDTAMRNCGYSGGRAVARSQADTAPETLQPTQQYARARGDRLGSLEAMEKALRYQRENGTTYGEAVEAVAGRADGRLTTAEIRKRFLQPSGTHVLPDSGPSFVGTGGGASEWISRQRADRERERKEARAERRRIHELARERGVPVYLAQWAAQMVEDGEATSAEAALDKLLDRERTRRMFGEVSQGLPCSSMR